MRMIQTRRLTRPMFFASIIAMAGCASGMQGSSGGSVNGMANMLSSWPEKQRETITMMTTKYGQPAVMADRMVVWYNTGPFTSTTVLRDAVPHNFPMPHMDYLTQTVRHTVPSGKVDQLHEYDGSVWVHRTRGEMSAQCDLEPMNFLALNLAHDIITGQRTVADARAFYAKTAMAFKGGDRSSAYVNGLRFQAEPGAADPGKPHSM